MAEDDFDWNLDHAADEPESRPPVEELEAERAHLAAVEAAEAMGRMNIFERMDFDRKRKSALELWVPPPEKGRARTIRGSIDATVGTFISYLIASKKWPWKNDSDFVRSAIKCLIVHEGLDKDEEYAAYFKFAWDMDKRAQLIIEANDTNRLVNQIESAAKALLALKQLDKATEYFKGEVTRLRARDDDFTRAVLVGLEDRFTSSGPGLRAVWLRAIGKGEAR